MSGKSRGSTIINIPDPEAYIAKMTTGMSEKLRKRSIEDEKKSAAQFYLIHTRHVKREAAQAMTRLEHIQF